MKHFNIYSIEEPEIFKETTKFAVQGFNVADGMKVLTVDLFPDSRQRIVSKGCVVYMNNGTVIYQFEGQEHQHYLNDGEVLSVEPGEIVTLINTGQFESHYLIIGNI